MVAARAMSPEAAASDRPSSWVRASSGHASLSRVSRSIVSPTTSPSAVRAAHRTRSSNTARFSGRRSRTSSSQRRASGRSDSTPPRSISCASANRAPHVICIERSRALVLPDRLLEPPAEAGELALQEGDRAAVRRKRVSGLQRDRSALVVAHAHLGDGQVAVDGRLSRRQLARPHELIASVAEQAHLERRQAPVEDAHRLPMLGGAGRRHPRGCAGDPIPRTPLPRRPAPARPA